MTERPVLVATDLSAPADEAIRQGDEWARLRGARLCVCHVAPRLFGSEMLFPQRVQKQVVEQAAFEARLAAQLRERVVATTGRDRDDFDVILDEGAPYAEIVREAESLGAGWIVVASHALSGLTHVFLGDVAERVVRYAHCPVLVARPHARTGRILVATDFSDAAWAALQAAAEQSRLGGARVVLMCSIERHMEAVQSLAELGGSGYGFVHAEYESAVRDATRQLEVLLERAGLEGDTLVTDANPAAGIVQAAAERDVELVVIGAAGRTGLRRLLVGSVAEKVTRHAPCSVLVVRPVGRG